MELNLAQLKVGLNPWRAAWGSPWRTRRMRMWAGIHRPKGQRAWHWTRSWTPETWHGDVRSSVDRRPQRHGHFITKGLEPGCLIDKPYLISRILSTGLCSRFDARFVALHAVEKIVHLFPPKKETFAVKYILQGENAYNSEQCACAVYWHA